MSLSPHWYRLDGSRDGMLFMEYRWVWLTPVVVSKISAAQGLDPTNIDSLWMQICLLFFSAPSFLYDHMHRNHGKDFVAIKTWSKSHMSLRFCFFLGGGLVKILRDPGVPLVSIPLKECQAEYLYIRVHSSIIYSSWKVEATQVCIDRWMENQIWFTETMDCCCFSKSCLTFCNLMDQAPLSMGFCRQEYWSGLPFPSPGDLPDPRIEPGSSALQAVSLPTELRVETLHGG